MKWRKDYRTSSTRAVRLSCLENAYSRQLLRRAILTVKVGHSDLVLACDQGLLEGMCMQDYKTLGAAVTICATLVNIQTYRQTSFDQLIWIDEPAELRMSTTAVYIKGDSQSQYYFLGIIKPGSKRAVTNEGIANLLCHLTTWTHVMSQTKNLHSRRHKLNLTTYCWDVFVCAMEGYNSKQRESVNLVNILFTASVIRDTVWTSKDEKSWSRSRSPGLIKLTWSRFRKWEKEMPVWNLTSFAFPSFLPFLVFLSVPSVFHWTLELGYSIGSWNKFSYIRLGIAAHCPLQPECDDSIWYSIFQWPSSSTQHSSQLSQVQDSLTGTAADAWLKLHNTARR